METPIFLTSFQIFISLTNQGDATGIRQAPLVRTKVVAGHQSHRKWYPRLFNNIVENNLLFFICSSLVIILLHMQKGNKFQVFFIKCSIRVKKCFTPIRETRSSGKDHCYASLCPSVVANDTHSEIVHLVHSCSLEFEFTRALRALVTVTPRISQSDYLTWFHTWYKPYHNLCHLPHRSAAQWRITNAHF